MMGKIIYEDKPKCTFVDVFSDSESVHDDRASSSTEKVFNIGDYILVLLLVELWKIDVSIID